MHQAHLIDDSVSYWFYSRDIGPIPCCIDLLEFTNAKVDPSLRFMAFLHRGHNSLFNHSLIGQASTVAEAVKNAERKASGLTAEEIQATPEGTWHATSKRPPFMLN